MRLAKSRATNTHGENVSPKTSAGTSTMSVILTPSLWLSQGGGVLISVEISRANFTLHSSAVTAAARLADRTRQSRPALAASDFRPRERPKKMRCAVWWRYRGRLGALRVTGNMVVIRRINSHVTRHTSHVTRNTSRIRRNTSHVTRHTSHVTRHTSRVTIVTRHS